MITTQPRGRWDDTPRLTREQFMEQQTNETPSGYKSCAEWPSDCCPSIGNYSQDSHDSKETAEAICRVLLIGGFGGDGKFFPVRTWVEPIFTPTAATPAVAACKSVRSTLDDVADYYIGLKNEVTGDSNLGPAQWRQAEAEALARQFQASAPHLKVWVSNVREGKA